MSILSKIRGLWRFDADEDPVGMSRRRFLFLGAVGGVVLVSNPLSLLPAPDLAAAPDAVFYDAFLEKTMASYKRAIVENFMAQRPVVGMLLVEARRKKSIWRDPA